jgi:cell division septation protein DedD
MPITALKTTLLIACLFGITACSTLSGAMVKTNTTNKYANQNPTPTELAICDGRTEVAKALARGDNNFSPKDRFISAYALELEGHPVIAKAIYMSLNDKDIEDERLSLSCNGVIHYDGEIVHLARSRIGIINAKLAAMDVDFAAPMRPIHSGLGPSIASQPPIKVATVQPSSSKQAPKAAQPTPAKKQPVQAENTNSFFKPLTVTLPASVDSDGKWFAHIASYRTEENATAYLSTLEGKYPALAGNIESWQVVTNDGATWRLGVRANEWSDADRLCVIIRSKSDYCRVIDTAK